MSDQAAYTLTSGVGDSFIYTRLMKAMILHAVIDSKKSQKDYGWLMKSELAEMYCESCGLDIYEQRKKATRIRKSDVHWRCIREKINKQVD